MVGPPFCSKEDTISRDNSFEKGERFTSIQAADLQTRAPASLVCVSRFRGGWELLRECGEVCFLLTLDLGVRLKLCGTMRLRLQFRPLHDPV